MYLEQIASTSLASLVLFICFLIKVILMRVKVRSLFNFVLLLPCFKLELQFNLFWWLHCKQSHRLSIYHRSVWTLLNPQGKINCFEFTYFIGKILRRIWCFTFLSVNKWNQNGLPYNRYLKPTTQGNYQQYILFSFFFF